MAIGFNPYDYGGYYPQYNNQYQNYQQQPQYNQYSMYQQAQPQQMNFAPLTYVNGIEGAKAYIVSPNQIVYLKDSDSNTLFEKRADAQGKYTLNAFELTAIKLEDVGKEATKDASSQKINVSKLASKSDLKNLQEQLDKITMLLEDKLSPAKGEE